MLSTIIGDVPVDIKNIVWKFIHSSIAVIFIHILGNRYYLGQIWILCYKSVLFVALEWTHISYLVFVSI